MSSNGGDRWAKALDRARATDDRLRDRGICPRCDTQFTDKGVMQSMRAMVQLHEALECKR